MICCCNHLKEYAVNYFHNRDKYSGDVCFPIGLHLAEGDNNTGERNIYLEFDQFWNTAVVGHEDDYARISDMLCNLKTKNDVLVSVLSKKFRDYYNNTSAESAIANAHMNHIRHMDTYKKILPCNHKDDPKDRQCYCCSSESEQDINQTDNFVIDPKMEIGKVPKLLRVADDNDRQTIRRHSIFLFESASVEVYLPSESFSEWINQYISERLSGLIVFVMVFLPEKVNDDHRRVNRLYNINDHGPFMDYLVSIFNELKNTIMKKPLGSQQLFGVYRNKNGEHSFEHKPLFQIKHRAASNQSENALESINRRGKLNFKKKTDNVRLWESVKPHMSVEDVHDKAVDVAEVIRLRLDKYRNTVNGSERNFFDPKVQLEFRKSLEEALNEHLIKNERVNEKHCKLQYNEESDKNALAYVRYFTSKLSWTIQQRCVGLYHISRDENVKNTCCSEGCIKDLTTMSESDQEDWFTFVAKLKDKCVLKSVQQSKLEKEIRDEFGLAICRDCYERNHSGHVDHSKSETGIKFPTT